MIETFCNQILFRFSFAVLQVFSLVFWWQSRQSWPVPNHWLSMTTYWRPDWSTGEVIHCDEHGCCISEHTVASGNSVSKWKRFKMFKILPDRLPDSHENARENVTDPGLFEWHWPPEGISSILSKSSTTDTTAWLLISIVSTLSKHGSYFCLSITKGRDPKNTPDCLTSYRITIRHHM